MILFRRIFIFLIALNFSLIAQNAGSLTYQFDKTTAIINATVFVDYQTKIDSAKIIIYKGKILNVGRNIDIPQGADILDYTGKTIYPSFVDIYTNYGLNDQKSVSGNRPQYETATKGAYNSNQAIRAELEADKNFKHDPARAKQLRELGFGTVVTAHTDGIIRGTSATVLLADLQEKDLMVDPQTSMNLSFEKGSSTQEYPSSLMGSIALIRQTLYDASHYGLNRGKIPYDISLERLDSHKEKPWIFETSNVLNALRALKIANEFGKKVLLHANSDEYQQIEDLKSKNVFLIVGLNFPEAFKISNPKDAEWITTNQLMEWYFAPSNIALLTKAKIDFALTTHRLKDLKDFNKNLIKVFGTGITEKEVLKSLTANPCKALGLYDKVGSLHTGKYANFIVSNTTLSAKNFKIYENWVKGEKYEINKIDKDFSGSYKLRMKGYPELKLEINTKLDKPKVTLSGTADTTKYPVEMEIKGDIISLVVSISKLDSSIKNKIYLKSYPYEANIIKGTAANVTWSADKVFEAIKYADLVYKDTISSIKVKPLLIDVPKPFSTHGRDSIPQFNNLSIKNAVLWTGETTFELQGYTLIVKNGVIQALEKQPDIHKYFNNEKYIEIDATGKYVTAGIIDEHSHIALSGGVNEVGKSVTSEVRIQDVINPNDINIYRQLAGGVTTSHILHGSANCIGGQSALINLKWGQPVDQLLFKGNIPFIKFALGENVKQSNWGDKYVIRYPQTRMGVEQTFMDAFQRALEYKQKKENLRKLKSPNTIYPKYDLELEALQEILEHKRFITCHSYSQSEINMLMKVAERYHIKINTFTHALEGYKIADKLKAHGAGASSFSDWWSFKAEVRDAIPQNASILHDHGVIVAINSDDAEMGRRLNQEAAKSVKYGNLSFEDAWKLVTINPAKLLNISDRVGSLKVGKLANIVIWSGVPLSIYAKPEAVFIEGIKYFDQAQNFDVEAKNKIIRAKLLEELLNDKTPEDKKVSPKPEKQKHYHCETFETLE